MSCQGNKYRELYSSYIALMRVLIIIWKQNSTKSTCTISFRRVFPRIVLEIKNTY